MKATSKTIKWVEKERFYLKMEVYMKVKWKMEKDKDLES